MLSCLAINESEAGVDLALMQTSAFLVQIQSSWHKNNLICIIKASLVAIQRTDY